MSLMRVTLVCKLGPWETPGVLAPWLSLLVLLGPLSLQMRWELGCSKSRVAALCLLGAVMLLAWDSSARECPKAVILLLLLPILAESPGTPQCARSAAPTQSVLGE